MFKQCIEIFYFESTFLRSISFFFMVFVVIQVTIVVIVVNLLLFSSCCISLQW